MGEPELLLVVAAAGVVVEQLGIVEHQTAFGQNPEAAVGLMGLRVVEDALLIGVPIDVELYLGEQRLLCWYLFDAASVTMDAVKPLLHLMHLLLIFSTFQTLFEGQIGCYCADL